MFIPTTQLTQQFGETEIYDSILSVAAASFDVTDIPQTYAHLHLVANLRSAEAATLVTVKARFNNDSGANYDSEFLSASNVTVSAVAFDAETELTLGEVSAASAVADTSGSIDVVIPNYASSTFQKTCISNFTGIGVDTAGAGFDMGAVGSRWRSTAAITRITVFGLGGANFVAGSRLSLYGLG